MAGFAFREFDFDDPGDLDRLGWSGVGAACYGSLTSQVAGVLAVTTPATDTFGCDALVRPASILMGKGQNVRASFFMNLDTVTNCRFGFGMTASEHKWLQNGVQEGFALYKDSGDSKMHSVVCDGNQSSTYANGLTANRRADVVRIVPGWGIWSVHVMMDPDVFGKGVLRWYVNGRNFHNLSFTNMPSGVPLTPCFGVYNGENVSRTLYVDYMMFQYKRFIVGSNSTTASVQSGGDGKDGDGGNGKNGLGGDGAEGGARFGFTDVHGDH